MLRKKMIAFALTAVLAAQPAAVFADTGDEIAWAEAEKEQAETELYHTQDHIDDLSEKKTELVSKFFNHASMKYEFGYRILTLLWTDGYSNVPVNFALCPLETRRCSFPEPENTMAVRFPAGSVSRHV